MNQQEAAVSSHATGQSVGQAIRGQRLKLGLSQEALAEAIGVSARSIRRWELDQAIPHEVVRNRLCAVFGVENGALFGAWSIEQASSTSLSLWHVPLPRNPFFTGREELLHALHERLKNVQTMALTQSWAISGLGGIGKTQIALEYAYQHARDYFTIFWISAATQESLQADLAAVAELLKLPEKDEHDHTRVIRAVKQWLATHQNWLLILDNVDDLTIAGDVLPAEHSGHLLLTTRAQALGALAQRIDVEEMGMAEGTLFLLRRAKLLEPSAFLTHVSQEQLAAAEAIVIEMDFLPLALDQAGAYIEEIGCSLLSYLELYRTHRAELLQRRGHVPSAHPESVATTWSLNFGRIEQTNPAATELLRLCAFLSPDAIPEELISEGSAALSPVLQRVATDAFALNEAIEELRKFSLVQRNSEARLLRLHRLVQAILQDAMEEEERHQWAERAVRSAHYVFPETVEMANWLHCQRFLAQAQACSVLIQNYAFVFPEAAALLFRTATYLSDAALYEQAEPLYQRALCIREQALGPEHPEVADSLKRLGYFYHRQGKYEQAEPLFQRALCIQEQALEQDHPSVAALLGELGCLFVAQGKYEQAELLLQRALSIWEKTPEADHLDSIASLNGLAILFAGQGKYEQAEVLFQRTLHIREQALGPLHADVAESLNNLAVLSEDQEKYAEAELLYQRAIGIWEQVLRPEHPYLAYPLKGLADLYRSRGKDDQAEPLYRRALSIWEQAFGPEHPHVASALNGLANLFRNQGMDQQAESLYQRTLAVREQTLGKNHLDTAETLHDFAILREAQGMRQEAALLYQRALAIWEQVLGAKHSRTIDLHERLRAVLVALERSEEMEKRERDQREPAKAEEVERSAEMDGELRNILPSCPYCQSNSAVVKSGCNKSGSQRWRCHRCHRYFTPQSAPRGYDRIWREQALLLASQGKSSRFIARQMGVNHRTIRAWVKAKEEG